MPHLIHWRGRPARASLGLLCGLALGVTSAVAAVSASTGAAGLAAGCDLYASPSGNDANAGTTPAVALASPITLLSRLAPGQVGCLEDGANFVLGGGAGQSAAQGTAAAPKTIRPTTPGARATITMTTTQLYLMPASHDLVLKDLDIRRSGTNGGSLFMVDGDRITLDGLDLSYPSNICLDVGGDPRPGGNQTADSTDDFALLDSRVHDCGAAYGPPHETNDSGVHGIYLQFLRDGSDADGYSAILRNNVIDHNHNRGLQLYPDARDTLVTHNVLYANGANLNLGSESASGLGSTGNTITDNIIAESTLDGLTPGGFVGDTAEVLGNFPPGSPLSNHVDRNCVVNSAHPTHLYEGYSYTHVDNVEQQPPVFVDAPGGDYRQTAASPCLGKGLEQATVPGRPTVSQSTPAPGAVTVAFTPPASDGGSPITQYTAQCVSTDGGVNATATGVASPIKVSGLTGGKQYHCRVAARNAVGSGPYGGYGALVTVQAPTAPGAPVVTATAASAGALTVSFNPPASDGGSKVLQYTVLCVAAEGGGTGSATATASPVKVAGLTGGVGYRCRAGATNAVGAGSYGAYGATVQVPAATVPPSVPVTGSAATSAAITVSFGPPTADGGAPVVQYTASCTSSDGGLPGASTGTGSPIKVAGLTRSKQYRCRVRAANAVGVGPYGAYGATVTVP